MKYASQKVAYWFFASALLLFVLQLVYGFIMGFAHVGLDVLHQWIPFNTARAVHTNLLVFCGDRHWQYVSRDPATSIEEWSVGAATDNVERAR